MLATQAEVEARVIGIPHVASQAVVIRADLALNRGDVDAGISLYVTAQRARRASGAPGQHQSCCLDAGIRERCRRGSDTSARMCWAASTSSVYPARVDLDDFAVLRVMRIALGDPHAELRGWSIRAMGGGVTVEVGASGGVQRVAGMALSDGREVAWTAILKVLRRSRIMLDPVREIPTDDPSGWAFWRREAHVYEAGLLDDLEGLIAPRCYAIDATSGEAALWLEDAPNEGPSEWPMERYGLAARHLGQFNGRYLTGTPVPQHRWLSTGRVREWLDLGGPGVLAMQAARDGLPAAWLSDRSVARIGRLWDERDAMIAALESLPVTLCHHDAGRRNLARRRVTGQDRTGAFDWQMIGTGHLGEEPAALFAVSLQMLDVPVAEVRAFERIVLDGYVQGLRDVGWKGESASVRLGFAIAASLLIGVGGAGMWFTTASQDGDAMIERMVGRSVADLAAQWSAMQPYLLDLGEEALAEIMRRRARP